MLSGSFKYDDFTCCFRSGGFMRLHYCCWFLLFLSPFTLAVDFFWTKSTGGIGKRYSNPISLCLTIVPDSHDSVSFSEISSNLPGVLAARCKYTLPNNNINYSVGYIYRHGDSCPTGHTYDSSSGLCLQPPDYDCQASGSPGPTVSSKNNLLVSIGSPSGCSLRVTDTVCIFRFDGVSSCSHNTQYTGDPYTPGDGDDGGDGDFKGCPDCVEPTDIKPFYRPSTKHFKAGPSCSGSGVFETCTTTDTQTTNTPNFRTCNAATNTCRKSDSPAGQSCGLVDDKRFCFPESNTRETTTTQTTKTNPDGSKEVKTTQTTKTTSGGSGNGGTGEGSTTKTNNTSSTDKTFSPSGSQTSSTNQCEGQCKPDGTPDTDGSGVGGSPEEGEEGGECVSSDTEKCISDLIEDFEPSDHIDSVNQSLDDVSDGYDGFVQETTDYIDGVTSNPLSTPAKDTGDRFINKLLNPFRSNSCRPITLFQTPLGDTVLDCDLSARFKSVFSFVLYIFTGFTLFSILFSSEPRRS